MPGTTYAGSLDRRQFLMGSVSLLSLLAWPRVLPASEAWKLPQETARAIESSPLVYLSPLRAGGSESRCHGEIWFVPERGDLLVVTTPDRWRARAVAAGLDRARIWVGDFGVWKRAEDRFRRAPSFTATASFEKRSEVHARALEAFGVKYSDEWGKWGPRFRDGLADGSRVMLRYTPAAE